MDCHILRLDCKDLSQLDNQRRRVLGNPEEHLGLGWKPRRFVQCDRNYQAAKFGRYICHDLALGIITNNWLNNYVINILTVLDYNEILNQLIYLTDLCNNFLY
jgi:hypothetical protein